MSTREDTGMRPVWSWALSWFRSPPSSTEKRARQAALVGAIQAELGGLGTVEALHERYCRASEWTVHIARRRCPQDWPLLGLHACTATAFALRYVEIVTGNTLSTDALPRWLGEWTIP